VSAKKGDRHETLEEALAEVVTAIEAVEEAISEKEAAEIAVGKHY